MAHRLIGSLGLCGPSGDGVIWVTICRLSDCRSASRDAIAASIWASQADAASAALPYGGRRAEGSTLAYLSRRMKIGAAGDAWQAAGQGDWIDAAGMPPAHDEGMRP